MCVESSVAVLSLAGPNFKFMDTPHMIVDFVSIRADCWVARRITAFCYSCSAKKEYEHQ